MFDGFAAAVAKASASPYAFAAALSSVLIWAACGPYFDYSEMWQIVINTGTTIITFLLAFIILASNARSEAAVQLKLDELIRSAAAARNELIGVEQKSVADIQIEAVKVRRQPRKPKDA